MARKLARFHPHFFAENFVYTLHEEGGGIPSKYPIDRFTWTQEFFDHFQKSLDERLKNIILWNKSGQMMGSWTVCACALWAILFRKNVRGLFISKRERDVDDHFHTCNSLMGKIHFMVRFLPEEWRKTLRPIHLGWESTATGSTVIGETANLDAGRGGAWSFVYADELGFNEFGAANFKATKSRCYGPWISTCTPNWRKNVREDEFSRLWFQDKAKNIIRMQTLYNLHPDRQSEEWWNRETEAMSQGQIDAELLGKFGRELTGRCFFTWDPDMMVRDVPYISKAPIWRIWDPSPNWTAIIWMQIKEIHTAAGNLLTQIRIINHYENQRQPYGHYRQILAQDEERYYGSEIYDIGDPWMLDQKDSAMFSWRINLAREETIPSDNDDEEEESLYQVFMGPADCANTHTSNLIDNVVRHMKLVRLPDGTMEPLFVVDTPLRTLVEHIECYSRPPMTRADQEEELKEKPIKDKHAHTANCIEYGIWHVDPGSDSGRRITKDAVTVMPMERLDLGIDVGGNIERELAL